MGVSVCLIGCGKHGRQVYVDSLLRYKKENPKTRLLACCDLDEERAMAFMAAAGFERAYTNYSEMLEKERPDAVLLPAPFEIIAPIATDILKKGFPLLMEKPPGETLKDAAMISGAFIESGTPNQVAFNRRFIPVIKHLMREIDGEKIQHIDYQMYRTERRAEHFYSTAIHGVDLVGFAAGSDYKYVDFTYGDIGRFGKGVVNILLSCEFESGATAQLTICPMSALTMERMTVVTDAATYFVSIPIWNAADKVGYIEKYEKGQVVWKVNGNDPSISQGDALFENNGFYAQTKSFLDDIKNGKEPAYDIFSALNSMAVADAMRRRQNRFEKK